MTIVYCYNSYCIHCDPQSFTCTNGIISVGDNFDAGCEDYEAYNNCEEYGEKFYIVIAEKGKPFAKAIRYGKRIEYKGREFYTLDRVTEDGAYRLTDKRTGIDVGEFRRFEKLWDKYIELEKKYPDVTTYPLAEYDGHGKYKIVEEQK